MRVTSLTKGRKTFVIQDVSSIHNFHLTGPGVNRRTTIGGRPTVTWVLTLQKGTYRFVCDAHSGMRGSFRVT
jgi:plastocyanin